LLAEFHAREGLPAILEAISLPDDGPEVLFGDSITEDLSRVLAILTDDPFDAIDQLIADRSLDEFVRWGAAGTYILLVRDGRLTRETAVERLRDHLRTACANEDVDIVTPLLFELDRYAPQEAIEEIEAAFRLDLVAPYSISLDQIRQDIAAGEASFQESLQRWPPTAVSDTVEELSHWDWSGSQDDDFYDEDDDELIDDLDEEDVIDEPAWDDSATIRITLPHIGRNERCPCGSGKKYKKCCGARPTLK
jgi:hypothetical protein